MNEVDYAQLSGQYAGFLVAVGGVSITVLTLVLSFSPNKKQKTPAPNALNPAIDSAANARVFLVAALIAATVSCFVGAHMMAETAAFFTREEKLSKVTTQAEVPKITTQREIPLGRRLFVLATTNIFIAIALVLFSIVLLPTATGDVKLADGLRLISLVGFLGVVAGALCWMAFAGIDRMGVGNWGWLSVLIAVVIGTLAGFFYYLSKKLWLRRTFIFIVAVTAASLIYFAIIFNRGGPCGRIAGLVQIGVFSLAITISYAFLVVAHLRILWDW
jgi:hypothetical protein